MMHNVGLTQNPEDFDCDMRLSLSCFKCTCLCDKYHHAYVLTRLVLVSFMLCTQNECMFMCAVAPSLIRR